MALQDQFPITDHARQRIGKAGVSEGLSRLWIKDSVAVIVLQDSQCPAANDTGQECLAGTATVGFEQVGLEIEGARGQVGVTGGHIKLSAVLLESVIAENPECHILVSRFLNIGGRLGTESLKTLEDSEPPGQSRLVFEPCLAERFKLSGGLETQRRLVADQVLKIEQTVLNPGDLIEDIDLDVVNRFNGSLGGFGPESGAGGNEFERPQAYIGACGGGYESRPDRGGYIVGCARGLGWGLCGGGGYIIIRGDLLLKSKRG